MGSEFSQVTQLNRSGNLGVKEFKTDGQVVRLFGLPVDRLDPLSVCQSYGQVLTRRVLPRSAGINRCGYPPEGIGAGRHVIMEVRNHEDGLCVYDSRQDLRKYYSPGTPWRQPGL